MRPAFVDQAHAAIAPGDTPLLCYGMGRSYGDVCLNADGRLLVTDRLDHVLEFDRQHGILRAEAGMTLDRLLRLTVPHGWFVPVLPGTKFVTLGGAVANDVHGKNHEHVGTFGMHVRSLALMRSSGETLTLTREQNGDLFAATLGGLGLTGAILWVELQLGRIQSATIETETLAMSNLDDFFRLSEESGGWPFKVAWVDCLASGAGVGRGLYIRGRHAGVGPLAVHGAPRLSAAFDLPAGWLNGHTIRLFNLCYRHRPFVLGARRMHYDPFFFPLDAVNGWNRLYGRRGFFQHQSVIPMARAQETLRELLETTAQFGQGSFLMVLKLFGDKASPGVLSFPLPGATLALDFPNKGEDTRRLLDHMAGIVLDAGGRLYPAKDATMSGKAFRAGYPHWRKVERQRDPAIMSDFWRRVTDQAI
jgi:L-gulonolactone oxidase